MKNLKNILIVLFLLGFVFSGCDIIDPPFLDKVINGGDDTTKKVKRILLEDFTGFTCKNCPAAHDLAHDLKELYGERLVIMSIHAGPYAEPTAEHTYDFRTEPGTEIDQFFQISAVGNPYGMANRRKFNGLRILPVNSWDASIQSFLHEEPIMTIKITPSYNSTTRKIDVDVEVKYLREGTPHHHLAVFIVEDSIVQFQIDKRETDPDVEDYVHNNVLRGSMNGTWGDALSNLNIEPEAEFTKHYSYVIPQNKDWRPEKLKIIAYIHDKDDSFEILQAEEESLIK